VSSVGGWTLESFVAWHVQRGRRIAIQHAVHITIECCRALAVLDREPPDIVPRDIRPENILVSKYGEVSLVSFVLAEVRRRVQGGLTPGFNYCAPELASGQAFDRRTDVFSLGILLWEMLTNDRLFLGRTDYQTIELVREPKIPSIVAKNPDVEATLEAIVLRALAKDPAHRYPSTALLGDALVHYRSSPREVAMRGLARLVSEMNGDVQRLPN
jgi:serine/threonine-protein kinase